MNNRRVLVTGGAGFLGSHLTRLLAEQGASVLVFDNFFTGKEAHLHEIVGDMTIHRGDLRPQDEIERAVSGFKPDTVFHLAALHYIPYCNQNPLETVDVNVKGTESLLQACRAAGCVEKLVFASTAAVYPICDVANREEDAIRPMDIYGNTKYFGEHLVRTFHQDTGVACAAARLFNIFGTNETNQHVIPAILDQVRAQQPTIELGNLEPKRDYIFVLDVARALLALEKIAGDFDVFNVGTGSEHSVKDLVDTVCSITQTQLEIKQVNARTRKNDRLHLLADIGKIRQATDWAPEYDLEAGLRALIEVELANDLV